MRSYARASWRVARARSVARTARGVRFRQKASRGRARGAARVCCWRAGVATTARVDLRAGGAATTTSGAYSVNGGAGDAPCMRGVNNHNVYGSCRGMTPPSTRSPASSSNASYSAPTALPHPSWRVARRDAYLRVGVAAGVERTTRRRRRGDGGFKQTRRTRRARRARASSV